MARTSLPLEADGSVVFEMKRAYADGTAALRFTPEELVARLVAIVPPAGANQVVYRGVLAGVPPTGGPAHGNAALCAEIVPKTEQAPSPRGIELGPLTKKAKGSGRRPRATWAQLVWRVFVVGGGIVQRATPGRGAHRSTTGHGAKMELRHGMEGGPTTKRVLAGLIRRRASQTSDPPVGRTERAEGARDVGRARAAQQGPMAGIFAGPPSRPGRIGTFGVWNLDRVVAEFAPAAWIGESTERPMSRQGQPWEAFMRPVLFEVRGWYCPSCGAKMELRHGMEGGPTTKRVLAGLIRAAAPR